MSYRSHPDDPSPITSYFAGIRAKEAAELERKRLEQEADVQVWQSDLVLEDPADLPPE